MVFFSLLSYTTIFDAIKLLRKGSLWGLQNRQNAVLREAAGAECAFP